MIELKSKIKNDSYTKYIYKNFDIQNTEEVTKKIPTFEIPDGKWNIGLIYGNSGSGKTTLINSLGGEFINYRMNNNIPLISNFNHLSEEEASKLLSSVGLSSVPSWLKPYSVLSNGEKFRADMAMKLSKDKRDITFIDEFTSVVNRDVAKSVSVAISKYINKNNKKVIFSSCHDDIIEWLQPNWIYYPELGKLVKKKSKNDHLLNYVFLKGDMIRGKYLQSTTI